LAFSDFHTHTVFSDGLSTVRDYVVAAREKGLLALGISDYSYTPFDTSYCMRPETNMALYEKAVREEAKRAFEEDGFSLLLGIEHDFGSTIDRAQYDYTIGSVHYIFHGGEIFSVDNTPEEQRFGIDHVFGGNTLDFAKVYFEHLVKHAEQNKPTFIGHLDLLAKYGNMNESDPAYLAVVKEAIEEIVKHVPLFEVSAGAIIRGLRTVPYPAPHLLSLLADCGARVILSSDAHESSKLTYYFPEMLKILKANGFHSVTRLTPNGTTEDTIESLLT
jgi:histidinol-phosphatase (PHP family)